MVVGVVGKEEGGGEEGVKWVQANLVLEAFATLLSAPAFKLGCDDGPLTQPMLLHLVVGLGQDSEGHAVRVDLKEPHFGSCGCRTGRVGSGVATCTSSVDMLPAELYSRLCAGWYGMHPCWWPSNTGVMITPVLKLDFMHGEQLWAGTHQLENQVILISRPRPSTVLVILHLRGQSLSG